MNLKSVVYLKMEAGMLICNLAAFLTVGTAHRFVLRKGKQSERLCPQLQTPFFIDSR
jgi:hypothetical protein